MQAIPCVEPVYQPEENIYVTSVAVIAIVCVAVVFSWTK